MKRIELIFTVILTVLIALQVGAQEKTEEDPVFYIVEEMPEYPGGEDAMKKFISENVKYPEEAQKKKIEGKVFVSFIVSENGKVKNAKVARSIDPLIDKEALRVINSMPEWTPGKQRGKKVNVQFTLPINFSLGEEQ